AVVLPSDEAGDAVAFLHAGALEDPMLGPRTHPVAAAVDRLDVAGADEVALVRAALGEGAVLLLAQDGPLVLATVRAAPEHDPLGPAVGARLQRRQPADGVAREEEQADARVAQLDDTVVGAAVPVFVVADAEKRLALEAALRGEHVAVGAVGDV